MKFKYIIILSIAVLINITTFCQNRKYDNPLQDYELSKQYVQQEKYSEAESLLKNLLKKNFDEKYYRLLLSVYQYTDNKKQEENLIKQAVKKNTGDNKYLIELGDFYIRNNEGQKADRQFENALKNLTANNTQITLTANNFMSLRYYQWAEKTYLTGRKIFKDNTRYTYELAYVYQLLGKEEKIAEQYILLLEKNPGSLNQIEINLNNLFQRQDNDKLYNTIHQTVLDKVKQSPDVQQYSLLYYWLLMQKEYYSDAFIQAKAITKRFKQENFETLLDFALSARNSSQYGYATECYDYILKQKPERDLSFEVKKQRLTCLYEQFTGTITHTEKQTSSLLKEYERFFSSEGYTANTSDIMQQYAELSAYTINEPQTAVDILDSIINMPSVNNMTKAECKLIRADIYLINGDIWEASLTYSQVEKDFKNETIGSKAKFSNAMLSYYTGDFSWALSQFDALRSSTAKLIANDAMEYSLLIKENIDEDSTYKGLSWYAKADFYLYQNLTEKALEYLDSVENWYVYHPLFDEILLKRGQIAIKQQNYQKAVEYLEDLILKYPYDLTSDDAVMLLASLYKDNFKDKDKAKFYYEKIILDYPSSLYVNQARKLYSELQ